MKNFIDYYFEATKDSEAVKQLNNIFAGAEIRIQAIGKNTENPNEIQELKSRNPAWDQAISSLLKLFEKHNGEPKYTGVKKNMTGFYELIDADEKGIRYRISQKLYKYLSDISFLIQKYSNNSSKLWVNITQVKSAKFSNWEPVDKEYNPTKLGYSDEWAGKNFKSKLEKMTVGIKNENIIKSIKIDKESETTKYTIKFFKGTFNQLIQKLLGK
jgi:hypothetical protein